MATFGSSLGGEDVCPFPLGKGTGLAVGLLKSYSVCQFILFVILSNAGCTYPEGSSICQFILENLRVRPWSPTQRIGFSEREPCQSCPPPGPAPRLPTPSTLPMPQKGTPLTVVKLTAGWLHSRSSWHWPSAGDKCILLEMLYSTLAAAAE